MKCPKCHYLSFEPEPRCRNCGYSFSLAEEADVLIREPESSAGVFADLDLRPAALTIDQDPVAPSARPPASRAEHTASPPVPASASALPSPPIAATAGAVVSAGRPAPTTELPLFVKALSVAEPDARPADDPATPFVEVPADPRPPLSVRRKTPEPAARARSASVPEDKKLGPFDRDLLEDLQRIEQREARGDGRPLPARHPEGKGAAAGARVAAAAVDAALLGATATLVLWTTLRWCDLPVDRIAVLPIAPTAAFLALVGAGYLLMFTAFGGQTLGKMALGIRVVSAEEDRLTAVSGRQALYRAVLTLPSVLVFGLGFVPALVGNGRALHDRVAHTRVVRA